MGVFTYPRSEPGSSRHQDLIERLNGYVTLLVHEVLGLPEAVLIHRPKEGEWSIKEVCGHLCDDAHFFHQRLIAMVKQEQPYLESWDQEAQMRERNPQAVPIDGLLAEFSAQSADTVEMLAELAHWNWARQGRHEERGRLSVRQLVDWEIRHAEDHLAQIRRLKAQAESPATTTRP